MSKQVPKVKESTTFNFLASIWIVPIIAIVIALWLAIQYYSKLGPLIEITFQSNEGLKAGQSQVKFRDVPIGRVEKVMLAESGEGVKVVARIDKEAVAYLNEEARFWIVKPEVGVGGISGLDTILGGTYINMMGQKKEMNKDDFLGLEKPYRQLEDGDYYHLSAQSSYNLKEGTPVYFKSMKAGNVEYVGIGLDGESVDVVIYVDKKYIPYIKLDSKFWVQNSVAVNYLDGQLNVNVAPLANIIRGGIEFSSSSGTTSGKVPYDYIFRLYKDSAVADEKKIGKGGKAIRDYEMVFSESTAKLKKDASIKFDKFDVGRVRDIDYFYDEKSHKMIGKVIASIDTSIFTDINDTNHTGKENLAQAIEYGLRASLQEYDPISGYLYVDLSFVETNNTKAISYAGEHMIFPTVSSTNSGVSSGLSGLINKLNKTLEGLNKMVGNKDFKNIPTELNKTMIGLQKALRSLDRVLKSNSDDTLLLNQLSETLKEVNKASIDTQKLFKKIDRKPNSLIFGE